MSKKSICAQGFGTYLDAIGSGYGEDSQMYPIEGIPVRHIHLSSHCGSCMPE